MSILYTDYESEAKTECFLSSELAIANHWNFFYIEPVAIIFNSDRIASNMANRVWRFAGV